MFTHRPRPQCQETCKELSTLGGKVHGMAADVSSKEGREARYKRNVQTNQQKRIIEVETCRNKLDLHFAHSQYFPLEKLVLWKEGNLHLGPSDVKRPAGLGEICARLVGWKAGRLGE